MKRQQARQRYSFTAGEVGGRIETAGKRADLPKEAVTDGSK